MAKSEILLEIDAQGSANTLGELEERAEKLTEALKGTRVGSQEFKALQKELIDTNRQVKNLELGMEALDAEQIASEFGGLTGAVGDVTGAMVLLGGENETLEQMAANIEQAIGISMALKGGIEGVTAAMKLLKNANPFGIIATIIGLVIAGVTLLIENLDTVIGFFKDFNRIMFGFGQAEHEAHQRRMAQHAEITEAHKERLKQIEKEKEARVESINEQIDALEHERERMEALGQDSGAVTLEIMENEKAILEETLKANKKKIESARIMWEERLALSGKSREQFIEDMKKQNIDLEDLQKRADAILDENVRQVEKAEFKITKFKREEREKRAAEAQKQADKEAAEREKELAKEQELLDRRIAAQLELDRLVLEGMEEGVDKRIALMTFEFEQRIALLDEKIPEENALIQELTRQHLEEVTRIEEEDRQLKIEQQKAFEEQMRAEAEATAKANIENAKKERDERIGQAQETLDGLMSINNTLFGADVERIKAKLKNGEKLSKEEEKRLRRQEAINKAFAVAQLAIDTAKAISGAVAQAQSVPYPGNIIAIVTGVAAVLANIAAAAQILGKSPPIPSGIGGGGGSPTLDDPRQNAPENNTPGLNPVGEGSTLIPQDQKVIVVESDITESQMRVASIEEQASF